MGSLVRSPGSEKHGLVTISTMELDKASKFGKWRNEVEAGLVLRKNLTVIMTDSAGVPVQKFHLMNAWPASVQIGSVPQGGEGWIQIDFGLAHEGITRE